MITYSWNFNGNREPGVSAQSFKVVKKLRAEIAELKAK